MIDEIQIVPITASGIGFCILISLCIGCRKLILKRRLEKERQFQQVPPLTEVGLEGEYVGGFRVGGYDKNTVIVVYPNTVPYSIRTPIPSAPPGNYETLSEKRTII
jgi:hypothetical protein